MNRNVLILSVLILLVAGAIFLWKVFGGQDCDEPQASLSAQSLKVGQSLEFEDRTEGAESWEWDFGEQGKKTEQKGTVSFGSPGQYHIVLTVNGKCQKTFDVRVASIQEPKFSLSSEDIKLGEWLNYADSTSGATSWSWNFGNGETSTSRTGRIKYTTAGEYTVTLEVNGKEFVGSRTVAVSEPKPDPTNLPRPLIRASKTQVLVGEEVVFTDMTPGAQGSKWKFGETGRVDETGPSVSHRFNTPGAYTVVLTNETRPGQQGRLSIRVAGPKEPTGPKVSLPANDIIKVVFANVASETSTVETMRQARGRLRMWAGNDMNTPVVYNGEETDLESYLKTLDIMKPNIIEVKTERTPYRIVKFIVKQQ